MAMQESEFRQLARQAAGGDPDAAERLIMGFHRHLMVFLYLSGIPDADIEDVAQNVALQVYRSLPRYAADRPFLPWMRGIALHLMLNYRRAAGRKQAREDLFRQYVERYLTEEQRLGELADTPSDRLRDCIGRLPEAQRQMVALRYRDGLSAEEISRHLQRNAAAIRKALSRIREALRACIEQPVPKTVP